MLRQLHTSIYLLAGIWKEVDAFTLLIFKPFNLAATASEGRHGEGEIQFSRLEALDPQKRELLEADRKSVV